MPKKSDADRSAKQSSVGLVENQSTPEECPECWRIFHAIAAYSDRILLFGPSGTGKTMQALRAALRGGQQTYSLILTEETPAAEIRGTYMPSPAGFAWHDGPAVRAWRNGGRLVLDEIDHASGDVMNLLMAIVDAPAAARITLPTGETVTPAPGFTVIATMNGKPDQLPPALRDRFTVTIEIDAVHPEALASLPARIRHAAGATALLPAERRLSVRSWVHFAYLSGYVGEYMAAAAVFGRERAQDVVDALCLATVDF